MPLKIKGQTYHRTTEACKVAGISRSTLLRWIRDGVLDDGFKRDRRGWRLFSEADVQRIAAEANKTK